MKWMIRRALHSVGYDLRRSPQLIHFLRSRSVDVVLDVGANIGQFATSLRQEGYRGKIVSFEPIAEIHAQLAQAAASDPRWTTYNCALGSSEGTAEIHVSDNSVFSSLLKLSEVGTNFDPNAKVIRSETIQVKRLDSIFHQFQGERVFLKIDTQGFEQEVLRGAKDSLRSICGVQLELPIEHLYEDSWSFAQALAFMSSQQFAVAQLRSNGTLLPGDRVSLCEVDAVFRRMPTPSAA